MGHSKCRSTWLAVKTPGLHSSEGHSWLRRLILFFFIRPILFQHSQLKLLFLILIPLGSGIKLLFPLLSTTRKSQHKMKGKPLLNAIIRLSPESSGCSPTKTGLCWSGGIPSGPWIYSVWGVSFKCDDLPVRVSRKICILAVVSAQVADQKVICSPSITF